MFHVVHINEPPRFRLNYSLPRFDLPQVEESKARWIIVPEYLLVYARMDLVKALCDRYGAERLVLFDYSDHGHGDYPCTVFALNAKHTHPGNVRGFFMPVYGKYYIADDGGKVLQSMLPTNTGQSWDVSFVGDGTSHPCRAMGIDKLRSGPWNSLVVSHGDGFICNVNNAKMDSTYDLSFLAKLMWCPPSRRPVTWRLNEAIAAGVPALTTSIWEHVRLPAAFDFLRDTLNFHREDMSNFEAVIESALGDETLEVRARAGQVEYRRYCETFWDFVAGELGD